MWGVRRGGDAQVCGERGTALGVLAKLRHAAWVIVVCSALTGAESAMAVPPANPARLHGTASPPLYTLASVGRDHGWAREESHLGKIEGLNIRLKSALAEVSRYFGKPVVITSGCRTPDVNRRAGGVKRSLHLSCLAADIKVAGVSPLALLQFARGLSSIGGIGIYCGLNIVHVDLGLRRTWSHPCRKRRRLGA